MLPDVLGLGPSSIFPHIHHTHPMCGQALHHADSPHSPPPGHCKSPKWPPCLQAHSSKASSSPKQMIRHVQM